MKPAEALSLDRLRSPEHEKPPLQALFEELQSQGFIPEKYHFSNGVVKEKKQEQPILQYDDGGKEIEADIIVSLRRLADLQAVVQAAKKHNYGVMFKGKATSATHAYKAREAARRHGLNGFIAIERPLDSEVSALNDNPFYTVLDCVSDQGNPMVEIEDEHPIIDHLFEKAQERLKPFEVVPQGYPFFCELDSSNTNESTFVEIKKEHPLFPELSAARKSNDVFIRIEDGNHPPIKVLSEMGPEGALVLELGREKNIFEVHSIANELNEKTTVGYALKSMRPEIINSRLRYAAGPTYGHVVREGKKILNARPEPKPTSEDDADAAGVEFTGAQGINRIDGKRGTKILTNINGDGEIEHLRGEAARMQVSLSGVAGGGAEVDTEVVREEPNRMGFFLPIKGNLQEAMTKNIPRVMAYLSRFCRSKWVVDDEGRKLVAQAGDFLIRGVELVNRHGMKYSSEKLSRGDSKAMAYELSGFMEGQDCELGLMITASTKLEQEDWIEAFFDAFEADEGGDLQTQPHRDDTLFCALRRLHLEGVIEMDADSMSGANAYEGDSIPALHKLREMMPVYGRAAKKDCITTTTDPNTRLASKADRSLHIRVVSEEESKIRTVDDLTAANNDVYNPQAVQSFFEAIGHIHYHSLSEGGVYAPEQIASPTHHSRSAAYGHKNPGSSTPVMGQGGGAAEHQRKIQWVRKPEGIMGKEFDEYEAQEGEGGQWPEGFWDELWRERQTNAAQTAHNMKRWNNWEHGQLARLHGTEFEGMNDEQRSEILVAITERGEKGFGERVQYLRWLEEHMPARIQLVMDYIQRHGGRTFGLRNDRLRFHAYLPRLYRQENGEAQKDSISRQFAGRTPKERAQSILLWCKNAQDSPEVDQILCETYGLIRDWLELDMNDRVFLAGSTQRAIRACELNLTDYNNGKKVLNIYSGESLDNLTEDHQTIVLSDPDQLKALKSGDSNFSERKIILVVPDDSCIDSETRNLADAVIYSAENLGVNGDMGIIVTNMNTVRYSRKVKTAGNVGDHLYDFDALNKMPGKSKAKLNKRIIAELGLSLEEREGRFSNLTDQQSERLIQSQKEFISLDPDAPQIHPQIITYNEAIVSRVHDLKAGLPQERISAVRSTQDQLKQLIGLPKEWDVYFNADLADIIGSQKAKKTNVISNGQKANEQAKLVKNLSPKKTVTIAQAPWGKSNSAMDQVLEQMDEEAELNIIHSTEAAGTEWHLDELLSGLNQDALNVVIEDSAVGGKRRDFSQMDIYSGDLSGFFGLSSPLPFVAVSPQAMQKAEQNAQNESKVFAYKTFAERKKETEAGQFDNLRAILELDLILAEYIKQGGRRKVVAQMREHIDALNILVDARHFIPAVISKQDRDPDSENWLIRERKVADVRSRMYRLGVGMGRGYGVLKDEIIRLSLAPFLSTAEVKQIVEKIEKVLKVAQPAKAKRVTLSRAIPA